MGAGAGNQQEEGQVQETWGPGETSEPQWREVTEVRKVM